MPQEIIDAPDPVKLQPWQVSWRAIARHLSLAGLTALRDALRADSPELIQGTTVLSQPSGLSDGPRWVIVGCCPIGYAGWKGEGLADSGAVANYFSGVCYKTRFARPDEPDAVSSPFVGWVDSVPRVRLIAELLPEVEMVIAERLVAA